jgi:hypothetical protein
MGPTVESRRHRVPRGALVINSGDRSDAAAWPQVTSARTMLNGEMAYPVSWWHRNRAHSRLHALLLGVTVLAVSHVACALPGPARAAAESSRADTSEPPAQSQGLAEPANTPGAQGRRPDSGHDQDLAPRRYLLAFGGAVSTGPAGLTGGFGTIAEGYVRANVLPQLGLGVSYFNLSVSNTDNYSPIGAQALEVNASWHPLKYSFDPFLQLGELRLFKVNGNVYAPPSPWNTEGQLGVNYVGPHFAIGLQVRSGFGHFGWLMGGFQLEGRI